MTNVVGLKDDSYLEKIEAKFQRDPLRRLGGGRRAF